MAFVYGKSEIKKRVYEVWVKCTGTTSFANFVRVGACLADNRMEEAAGDEIELNDSTKPKISKTNSVTFNVTEVTKENVDALRELINKDAEVIFTEREAGVSGAEAGDWIMKGINLFPALSIGSGSQNTIAVTGELEVAVDDVTSFAAGTGA